MKTVYPVEMIVKKGGSDSILKLFLKNKVDYWLVNKAPEKVVVHFGEKSFTNPTKGEWYTYHSFNNSRTISEFLSQHFALNDLLKFEVVEDKYGFLHFIHID